MQNFAAQREAMVDGQVRPADVTKYPIIAAMRAVPRERFVPADLRTLAYLGDDLPLGDGRAMLAPRTLAKMLDTLDPGPRDLVLDIGATYGYGTAVIARIAEAVVAVESDDAMAAEAARLFIEEQADNALMVAGDLAGGAPRHGPYDAVLVEGGAEAIPDAIVSQLKEGGRIAAVMMNGPLGEVRIGYKAAGRLHWRFAFNASASLLPGFTKVPSFEF